MPPGVLNATVCRPNDIPLMFSEPHFYQADHSYNSSVDGLKPDAALHESSVYIEPITGRVVNSSRKLQLNVNIARVHSFIPTLDLKRDTVFPVVWMDESFEMSKSERQELARELAGGGGGGGGDSGHYVRLRYVAMALMIAGAALMLFALIVFIVSAAIAQIHKHKQSSEERRPLLGDTSSTAAETD
jgi:hypothetical protein